MKKKQTNILLVIIFLIGVALLLYPTVSDWYNSFHQSFAIADYTKDVEVMDDEMYDKMLQDAYEYNRQLLSNEHPYAMSNQQREFYNSLLNVNNNGMMGYLEIPKIHSTLPIYHGIEESVLQVALGHLEGSSLPVGGESTHSVISGHRGLPSAKLFTNLDQLVVGDQFMIKVLDETLTYEINQILVVLPEETDALKVEIGKDYCTLVTCTPYGVNSHRLLVRGVRVENKIGDADHLINDNATFVEPSTMILFAIIPVILILIVIGVVRMKRKEQKHE